MTNVEEIGVFSESAPEAKRRKDRERKRTQRARDKSAKAAESETLQQAWERHSEKLKQDDPALYAYFFQRHQELADLEMEISDCEDFARGLHVEAKPQIAECWRDTQNEFEKHGECNYGAIDRREGFHPSGLTYDASDPYRWFGFRDRLSVDCFFIITRALVKYALTTKDESLDSAIVDCAVAEFTKRFTAWEINPGLIKLIRVYRGLPPEEPPTWEFLKASDGYCQKVPRSIAEGYRSKGIVFMSPAQLERLAEGRRNLE
jgi:hypothetical protein